MREKLRVRKCDTRSETVLASGSGTKSKASGKQAILPTWLAVSKKITVRLPPPPPLSLTSACAAGLGRIACVLLTLDLLLAVIFAAMDSGSLRTDGSEINVSTGEH